MVGSFVFSVKCAKNGCHNYLFMASCLHGVCTHQTNATRIFFVCSQKKRIETVKINYFGKRQYTLSQCTLNGREKKNVFEVFLLSDINLFLFHHAHTRDIFSITMLFLMKKKTLGYWCCWRYFFRDLCNIKRSWSKYVYMCALKVDTRCYNMDQSA